MQISKVVLHGYQSGRHLEVKLGENALETPPKRSAEIEVARVQRQIFGVANTGCPESGILGINYPQNITSEDSYWAICELRGNDWHRGQLLEIPGLIRTRALTSPRPFLFNKDKVLVNEKQVFFDPTQREWNQLEFFGRPTMPTFLKSLEEASEMAFVIRSFRRADKPECFASDIRFVYRTAAQHWHVVVTAKSDAFRSAFCPEWFGSVEAIPQPILYHLEQKAV